MTNWSNKTSLSKSAFDFALGVPEADWPDSQANPYSYEPTTFRLTGLVTTRDSDSHVLQDITYVYDPVGNIVKLTDGSHDCVFANNQEVAAACTYTYDAMYRLTAAAGREHIALAQNADTDATAFLRSAWAHLNNSQQLVNYTETYVYDTAGNLTQIQHAGASTYTRYIDIDTASNRGLQRPDQGQPDFANSFDANGNQVLMGHVDSLAWDYQDRLQKVVLVPREDDQDDAEWYVYDGAGQRVRKVRETVGYGGTTLTTEEKIYLGDAEIKRIYLTTYDEYGDPISTTKVLDRTSVHVMDDKSRVALVHYWSVDTNLLELDNTNQVNTHRIRYQFGNHLGSASLELDDAGSIISYEEYLPYGGTSFVAGTSQTEVRLKEYRYSGKERDNSTGFYYYGARYYAPWLGRWMSCDPAGPVDGPNLYWFVKGNPVGFVDDGGRKGRKAADERLKVSMVGSAWSASAVKEVLKLANSLPSRFGEMIKGTKLYLGDRIDAPRTMAEPQPSSEDDYVEQGAYVLTEPVVRTQAMEYESVTIDGNGAKHTERLPLPPRVTVLQELTSKIVMWGYNLQKYRPGTGNDRPDSEGILTKQGKHTGLHEFGHAVGWAGASSMKELSVQLIRFKELVSKHGGLPDTEIMREIAQRYGDNPNKLVDEQFAETFAIYMEDPSKIQGSELREFFDSLSLQKVEEYRKQHTNEGGL